LPPEGEVLFFPFTRFFPSPFSDVARGVSLAAQSSCGRSDLTHAVVLMKLSPFPGQHFSYDFLSSAPDSKISARAGSFASPITPRCQVITTDFSLAI